jgi:tetratricopeptide (TPR) repeat protein
MSKQLSLNPRVRKLLKKGIAHQQAGRPERAQACYQSSLKADPCCPQTLHLLGLLSQQSGEYQEAIRWIEQSLALKPDDADTLNSLGESYISNGQIQLASDCYQRLVKLIPQSGEAHHRLGETQEQLGDWDAATASYLTALALQSNSPDVLESLARLQSKQGAYGEAVQSCQRALDQDPIRHEVLTQMGNALIELGNYDAALNALRGALALKPDSASAVIGLGYFFERQGDLGSAMESYGTALKLNPQLGSAHTHLGTVHLLQGDLEKAAESFERLLTLEPDSAEARAFLGLVHLKQGNFRLGLREYESRWNTPYGLRFQRNFSQPLWNGEPLKGSRILLHAEQGMGDTLQFIRYVPLVAARGAEVVLEVQPRLHRLLTPMKGATEVICRGQALPEFDWQCPLLSLPLALGTELASIPAKIPYLFPDPALSDAWKRRLPRNSVRIGLVWAGNPLHPHEFWRSIPLQKLAPLTKLEGTTIYSLQMGTPADQLKQWGGHAQVVDLQQEQKDFADTAAIVANLDLVISIDTSVAHLAGAMGKPVWVLLCKSADWRWMLEREDSPWYPTARLFRQSTMGNWQDVVDQVEPALRNLVANAGSPTPEGTCHE